MTGLGESVGRVKASRLSDGQLQEDFVDDNHLNETRKERAALWSIAASAGITVAKGLAGLATGSLALISDAIHSLLDVAATTLTYVAVREGHKPADDRHQFGHGKFESMAALFETAFLFLLSGAVAYEGVRRLISDHSDIVPSWIAAWVLIGTIIVDGWRWWSLKRIAKETNSDALDADALHFSSDLINSVLVLGALAAAAIGYPQADSIVAIGVSFFIALAGFRLAQRTINTLLDAAPEGLAEKIRNLAQNVPGVIRVDHVRVRPAGGTFFGEILLRVPRILPLENAAEIKARVTKAIAEEMPGSEITILTEPTALDDETILERIMLIAAKRHLPIHHVMVQDVTGRLSISLDLEVDGQLSLGIAHGIASELEDALREEFGPTLEVDTHIEPLRVGALAGEDDQAAADLLSRSLTETAARMGSLHDVHSVRTRRTQDGLVVHYHCRFDPALSVASVHEEVDTLERKFRADHPEVLRVIGHAEPWKRGLKT